MTADPKVTGRNMTENEGRNIKGSTTVNGLESQKKISLGWMQECHDRQWRNVKRRSCGWRDEKGKLF